MEEVLKECQLCHQLLPKDQFYDRKDRKGEHTWKVSYCGPCDLKKATNSREKNQAYYKKYNKNQNHKYYEEHKDEIQITRRRYYYNKLSHEKQIQYKKKLQEKYPELIEKIFS